MSKQSKKKSKKGKVVVDASKKQKTELEFSREVAQADAEAYAEHIFKVIEKSQLGCEVDQKARLERTTRVWEELEEKLPFHLNARGEHVFVSRNGEQFVVRLEVV